MTKKEKLNHPSSADQTNVNLLEDGTNIDGAEVKQNTVEKDVTQGNADGVFLDAQNTQQPQDVTLSIDNKDSADKTDTQSGSAVAQDADSTRTDEVADTATSTQDVTDSKKSTVVVMERTVADEAFARHNVPVEKPVTTRKKSIFNTILLIVVCVLSIVIIFQVSSSFTEGNMKSLPEILASMDVTHFVIALALLLLLILVDSLKFYVISRAVSGKSKLLTSCKVGLLGKFYDNVTPFASGGQPMQIYYLTKKGYSAGQATGITLVKFFTQMFTWALVAGLLMGFNSGVLFKYISNVATRTTIQVLAWVGFGFNLVLPVMIILFVVVPKLATKLTYWTITLGSKVKIVKNKDKALAKAFAVVEDFKNSVKVMAKRPLEFIVVVLLCLIEPIVWIAFPYFILVAFATGPEIQPGLQMMIEIMALHIYASNSASIIPTPGNGGFIETTFSLAFASVSGNVLFWVVFMWRFCTYYIYLLVGFCISIFELIRKAVRKRRAKKREENK